MSEDVFNGSVRERMSPSLQARLAAEEAREAAEAAKAQRERTVRAAAWQERQFQEAVRDAILAGDADPASALRGRGVGNTPSDFIARASARMDLEDQQAAAEEARAYRQWKAQREAGTWADTTAPSAAEVQLQAQDQERTAKYRDRMIQRQLTLRQAREEAAAIASTGDRQVVGAVATAFRMSSEAGSQTGYRMS